MNSPNASETARSPMVCVEITLLSFGKKYGIPEGMQKPWFHCARIPNPPRSARRGRTGLDKRLRTEVMREKAAQEIVQTAIENIVETVQRILDAKATCSESNINQHQPAVAMVYGFGCCMGKHRSVSVVETVKRELFMDALKTEIQLGHVDIRVVHRELEKYESEE